MFKNVERPLTEGRAVNVPCTYLTFEYEGKRCGVSIPITNVIVSGGTNQERKDLQDKILEILKGSLVNESLA